MIRSLAQHEVGAGAGGEDVFAEVHQIDGFPDPCCCFAGLNIGIGRVAVEIGFGILEGAVAEREEAVNIPVAEIGNFRVDINREIEEVRNVGNAAPIPRRAAGLQNIDAFDDENIRLVNGDGFAGRRGLVLMSQFATSKS